ncbi:MAG TPA: leucine--tRNA ligase [Casimicrobiaceae bacterium]|nr:leucine--tRNA ligase [Casimicrobiaceae bacterium]
MNQPFDAAKIEASAQAAWAAADVYRAREKPHAKKFFCVSMLPYPSGKLHMGHVRNYTINDMMYRHLRMRGYNVLMPMGWDAFGLPAENAAIKNREAPAKWTRDNIAAMKQQMQALGLAIDWSREVATCDPAYYHWNQWFFLRMLEKGLAYRHTQVVNWDPADQTVLANEQVIDGRGWRTGALVERREIPGYYLRITDYAEELLAYLDRMPGWPERVKTMQANWIGRSEGVRFAFRHDVRGTDGEPIGDGRLYVFTTRADTIMGVTFVAVAAEHPIALQAAKSDSKLAAFLEECRQGSVIEADLATMDKKGMPTGFHATHPLSGERVEIWVGNYVLIGYGDGAVMGVPGHDERDFAFAKKYALPIAQVVAVEGETFSTDAWQPWYEDKQNGTLVNSGKYDALPYAAAVDAIAADLAARGLGEKRTTYRLRDWGISRQRYWGTPIPMIHCGACGTVPVPDEDLPVILPEDCIPDGSGNPLTKRRDFLDVDCPKCGAPAQRETDTMDTFVDSSWYYMRYTCPDAPGMVDERNEYWMPMDQYIGGIEHAILHLLYARFWTKAMRDMDLVKFDEPFTRLFTQGMLLNQIWLRRNDKGGVDYFPPQDVTPHADAHGRIVDGTLSDGTQVAYGGIGKMGKSENNGVDPHDVIARFGADTARLFVMFAGPPVDTAVWSDTGAEGQYRFLRRLWTFAHAQAGVIVQASGPFDWRDASDAVLAARRELHRTLGQANYDYERLQYNTVVSAGMKMLNTLEGIAAGERGAAAFLREGFSILLRVLHPVAPHTTWVLWNELKFDRASGDLHDAPWPDVDESALRSDEIELVLQVNGKLRGKLLVPATADKAAIEAAAKTAPEVGRYAGGAPVKKVVVVPGRLVNVVV